jgi:pyruvate/2-oxoglutarate dehydrogenase complex dihydrolipoamide acyltransferase (E2) component
MDVLMPQLGETVAEGKISKWFVKAGDAVKPGDNLFEIETDKVSMEVPAIAAGTLAAINVQAGEIAPVGTVVAIIQGSGETISASKPQAPLTPAPGSAQGAARGQASAGVQGQELGPRFRGDERAQMPTTGPKPIPMEPFREVRTPARNYGPARSPGGTTITPLARRLAGEAGIDLAKVKGSGPHGRIVAADIEQARKAPAPAPALGRAAAPIVLTADVAIGQALALCDDANAAQKTALELTDVVVKAWAAALRRVAATEPADVALMIGETRVVVPAAAAKPLTIIAALRRDGGASSDAQQATTAISIPAVAGITMMTDAPRPPCTTHLSLGAPRRAPVEAPDGAVRFVSVVTATLSCDPGAVDAARGAALLAAFKGFVEQPVTMIV